MLIIKDEEHFKANVLEAYKNAADAGWFEEYKATCRDVALDMIAYDALLEDYLDEDGEDDEELIELLISIIKEVHE